MASTPAQSLTQMHKHCRVAGLIGGYRDIQQHRICCAEVPLCNFTNCYQLHVYVWYGVTCALIFALHTIFIVKVDTSVLIALLLGEKQSHRAMK